MDAKQRYLWAKWGPDGSQRYPLRLHLLDTAIAAEQLLDRWLCRSKRAHLLGDEETLARSRRDLIIRAAGLHDVGKSTPIFQGQLLSPRAKDFAANVGGLWRPPDDWLGSVPSGEERTLLARHEIASAVMIDNNPDGSAHPSSVSLVATGHHGRWVIYDKTTDCDLARVYYKELMKQSDWVDILDTANEDMRGLLGIEAEQVAPDLPFSLVPLYTSLVSLSDWMASDTRSLDHGRRVYDQDGRLSSDYVEQRREWFGARIKDTLGIPHRPQGQFTDIFGFSPNSVQEHTRDGTGAGGLTIIATPMGAGKTEAAIDQWIRGEDGGLFFALPTMATADAMMDRVRSILSSAESTLANLTHSYAWLNSFYALPSEEITVVSDNEYGAKGQSEPEAKSGLTPGTWFNGAHRALLAPIAVGTIDQLLSMVIPHKYNYMRMLGAFNKTIVLDEVHSYDAYMHELLVQFLKWAGYLGIEVVILSATLPRDRLSSYIEAYSPNLDLSTVRSEYPYVLRVDAHAVVSKHVADTRSYEVGVRYIDKDGISDEISKVRTHHPDAKIGVIVNTVGMAQDLGRAHPDAMVLHSRYPAQLRMEITNEVIKQFGKGSSGGPGLLIGTQVVEQSIDLDFDVLITELAPAPSLLQRVGRLWRHPDRDNRRRPSEMREPSLVVAVPQHIRLGSESGGSVLPYTKAEIVRTWESALLSGKRDVIHVPNDMQGLVDGANISWGDIASEHDVKHMVDHDVKVGAARGNLIPAPSEMAEVHSLATFGSVESINEYSATRWNSVPTVTIIPVSSDADALCYPMADLPDAGSRPDRDAIACLLAHAVPVTGSLARDLRGCSSLLDMKYQSEALHDILLIDMANAPITLDRRLGVARRSAWR